MRKIKTQALGIDQRSLLFDMLAQNSTQDSLEQMRRRMITRDRDTTFAVDRGLDRILDLQHPFGHHTLVHINIRDLLRIVDLDRAILARYHAGIRALTALFRVKRRLVQYHGHRFAFPGFVDRLAIDKKLYDHRFRRWLVIPHKFRLGHVLHIKILGQKYIALHLAAGTGTLFLPGHELVKNTHGFINGFRQEDLFSIHTDKFHSQAASIPVIKYQPSQIFRH